MKTQKISNILMVLFFILVISIPLITINKTQGKISVSENRALANFPAFTGSDKKINIHFIKEFENWLNDNLGLRDMFVKANTILQFDLFGKLTKSDTMVGKDNWLYYVTPEILKDYQHLNLPSSQQLNLWGDSLEKVNNYLKMKNIPFITMLNLDKKTIYPENYPNSVTKVGTVSRTDMLTDYLTTKTQLDFFTPFDALMKAKKEATVYSPRVDNAHWNSYGAFIGYSQLMDRVKKYFPNVKILKWEDFDITRYEREVKVYDALKFTESDYAFKLKNMSTAVQQNGFFDSMNLSNNSVSFKYENSNKGLPKALVFGDSYFYGLLIPDLAESFSEFTFIHSDNVDKIESLVNLVHPDIVIFENVERMIDHSMDVLFNSKEAFVDYNVYQNLPVIKDPLMYMDYSNNELLQQQGKIIVDKSKTITTLSGWALDSKVNDIANSIYAKVGDKYYPGIYGNPHQGVSNYFKNPSLLNSGYVFYINSSELINAGSFSLITISKDKTYQYAPVEFKVEAK